MKRLGWLILVWLCLSTGAEILMAGQMPSLLAWQRCAWMVLCIIALEIYKRKAIWEDAR